MIVYVALIALAILAVGTFVVWWGRRTGTADTDADAATPAAAAYVPSEALSE